jgi:NADP-dependent 3-hydroxy acid dehydrogenase YdfG
MKSIFITGASAGIGKATAVLFAQKGWFVGITDVNEAGLRALKEGVNGRIGYMAPMDVKDAGRVAVILQEFNDAAGGKIDVLFNNAGILRVKPFENIPLVDQHSILDVNNKGVLNCTYLAFPYLKKTRGARVINMASVSSIIATPTEATYTASKFWVRGLTEALNMEWKRHGIHVCDIMPNYVNTPMVEQNPGKLVDGVGVNITAEDVAGIVWKAANVKRLHWIVDLPVNKVFYKLRAFIPFALERFVLRKLAGV